MKDINPMLLIDFYKAVHAEMLPEGITKSVSYYTPRMSRIRRWDSVVMFGLQGFIKEYLIDYFNENFFSVDANTISKSYHHIMDNALGKGVYSYDKIQKLHDLGYLPIEIVALPEGTIVPMHVPMFGITNTHKDFAWLPQALESLISAETWHSQLAATVAYTYRKIVNKWYERTCDNAIPRSKALSNFDFRGDCGLDNAVKTGAAWLTSFANTATVPAIAYLEQYYNCDCSKEVVGCGSPSTEHSVMCSNYAVDGDEITLLRRLLTEIYPHTSFTCVCDSYDYWNVVKNILPQIKPEIMAHDGCFLVRGDSGDCVDVVTKTVFCLWNIFGGTVNSKGYKVLDPHVKAIYGDSITLQRCEEIYEILRSEGFAASNVALGVGSFSMHCIEEVDSYRDFWDEDRVYAEIHFNALKPFTRDTFSSCIKATYCEIEGKPVPIFKSPKEGGFKKSQKGCCAVWNDGITLRYADGYSWSEVSNMDDNLLKPVFKDGKMIVDDSLHNIRDRLHGGKF